MDIQNPTTADGRMGIAWMGQGFADGAGHEWGAEPQKVTCVLLLESLCSRRFWWPELQLWEDWDRQEPDGQRQKVRVGNPGNLVPFLLRADAAVEPDTPYLLRAILRPPPRPQYRCRNRAQRKGTGKILWVQLESISNSKAPPPLKS